MSFEVKFEQLACIHSYDYDLDDPDQPGPFGRAVAASVDVLYEQGKIDGVVASARSLIEGRPPLAQVAVEPLRRSGKIPAERIIVLPKAATTYGGVRDYERVISSEPGIYSQAPIFVATQMHWGITDPLLDHFFPWARQSGDYKYYSIEQVLAEADPELLNQFQATPEYQGFKRYIDKYGSVYKLPIIGRVPFLEFIGPQLVESGIFPPSLKYKKQIQLMGWPVPQ